MFRSLLVPVDGSEHARHALKVACQLILPDGVLHLLHVIEPPPIMYGLETMGVRSPLDTFPEQQQKQEGQAIMDRMIKSMPSHQCQVDTQVLVGTPAYVIVAEAGKNGVDAIVMGSRGLSDIKGLMVGSVSHRVGYTAPCTVICVHDVPAAASQAVA
ncbi:universal stress protein [Kushneria phosphatilytica]|nr:universal stress protein [Kushneria phosphatilytica]OHV10029.1 hypothetical protein BH688_10495 [Kushneria phosphatilytica]